MLHDEIILSILKHIETTQNQRSLASELKISVGKVNYVLNALIDKGLIKAENFYQNKRKNQYLALNADTPVPKGKVGYQYLLTPKGFQEKVTLTENFIERKKLEYDILVLDLEQYKNSGVNI